MAKLELRLMSDAPTMGVEGGYLFIIEGYLLQVEGYL